MRLKKIMLAGVSMLAMTVASSEAMATRFGYTGTEDFYTIPGSGIYDVTVAGAQGGGSNAGLGAIIHGNVFLTAGTLLDIFVGGIGGSSGHGDLGGGGGGGGTFVFLDSPFSRLAVGGGGGGGGYGGGPGGPGQAGTAGQSGNNGHNGGPGGIGGNGGGGGTYSSRNGGGGTGFNTRGGDGAGAQSGYGGIFQLGGDGSSPGNHGGFGGGGGGGFYGGGGGGGYSGGGGGDGVIIYGANAHFGGGGGGSFLAPEFTDTGLTGGANYGYGYVTISAEPGTLPVLGSALLALGLWRRRRR